MPTSLYDSVWDVGVRIRDGVRRVPGLRSVEPALLAVGGRVFPAPKTETAAQLPDGLVLHIPPRYPAARSYANGRYEADVTQLFREAVREGMSVLDAGANVGYYTLIASRRVGPHGRVYAFEPDPLNFSYLTRNIAANSCANVRAFPDALGSACASRVFIPDPGGAEGYIAQDSTAKTGVAVRVTTIDEVLGKIGGPKIDLMKVDVEGSELDVLNGMHDTSRSNDRLELIIELNVHALDRSGTNPDRLAKLLIQLGFKTYRVIELRTGALQIAAGLPDTRATLNLHVRKR